MKLRMSMERILENMTNRDPRVELLKYVLDCNCWICRRGLKVLKKRMSYE